MDTDKYVLGEGDTVLDILVDGVGMKQVLVKRGAKTLVVIDVLPPFDEGFQPQSQVQISGLSCGHECYEIWIDGEYYTNYGSK